MGEECSELAGGWSYQGYNYIVQQMYEGNPREIEFGSSQHEVQVSEGLSYRESTIKFVHAKCENPNNINSNDPQPIKLCSAAIKKNYPTPLHPLFLLLLVMTITGTWNVGSWVGGFAHYWGSIQSRGRGPLAEHSESPLQDIYPRHPPSLL